jgi:hypothetical protein
MYHLDSFWEALYDYSQYPTGNIYLCIYLPDDQTVRYRTVPTSFKFLLKLARYK